MTLTHPVSLPLTDVPLEPSLLLTIGSPLLAATLLLAAWLIRRSRARPHDRRPGNPAVKVAALAAVGCTAYSADTSWRFAADYLDMGSTTERAAMFAAAELALFATALMARQNLSSQGVPGLPGVLVWVITGVQVIPAYAESGPVGGTVRAFVGPVMAAMLWHQAMGIELRLHKPDAASQGVLASLGREARERLLSRVGVAARDRDAGQITRDRATSRAVALASRLAGQSAKQRANRRGRRITRRLESALARACVGTDMEQRSALLDQLAARRHATALATIELPSPWAQLWRDQGEDHGDRSPLAPSAVTRVAVGDEARLRARVVTDAGPEAGASPIGDRPEKNSAGPAAGTEPSANGDRPLSVPNDEDRDSGGDRDAKAGSRLPDGTPDAVIGDGDDAVPEVDEEGGGGTGEGAGQAHEAAAQGAEAPSPSLVFGDGDRDRGRGHAVAEMGTEPGGDRPRSVPDDAGDRDRPDTEAETNSNGDRRHSVPTRSGVMPKEPRNRSHGGQVKRPEKQQLTVEQMVARVRPHVLAVLERDGNDSLTRVQLREILRAQGLKGGRNERLTPVLQRLRDEVITTTRRSTAR